MCANDFRKYFNKKKPLGPIVLLIFGILLLLIGVSMEVSPFLALIGVALSVGGISFIAKFSANQSDSAVDEFCASQANEYYAVKKAIVDSKGDAVADAIYSSGYCFENIFSARRAVRGKDTIWRSSIFGMF